MIIRYLGEDTIIIILIVMGKNKAIIVFMQSMYVDYQCESISNQLILGIGWRGIITYAHRLSSQRIFMIDTETTI